MDPHTTVPPRKPFCETLCYIGRVIRSTQTHGQAFCQVLSGNRSVKPRFVLIQLHVERYRHPHPQC